jgi:hypothetical protein
LGETNYKNLIDDLVDYSAAEKWNEEITLSEGEAVLYEGIIYIALEDIADDATTPDCSIKYEIANKFTKTCYNEAWTTGHLRAIIANEIYARAIPFYTDLLDAGGYADEANEKTNDRVNSTRSMVYSEITAMKNEFKCWNKDNNCFSFEICISESEAQKHGRKVAWSE